MVAIVTKNLKQNKLKLRLNIVLTAEWLPVVFSYSFEFEYFIIIDIIQYYKHKIKTKGQLLGRMIFQSFSSNTLLV